MHVRAGGAPGVLRIMIRDGKSCAMSIKIKAKSKGGGGLVGYHEHLLQAMTCVLLMRRILSFPGITFFFPLQISLPASSSIFGRQPCNLGPSRFIFLYNSRHFNFYLKKKKTISRLKKKKKIFV